MVGALYLSSYATGTVSRDIRYGLQRAHTPVRAGGEQLKLRVIQGGAQDVGQALARTRPQVLDFMAPPAGVEPTTYRLGGGRSIH